MIFSFANHLALHSWSSGLRKNRIDSFLAMLPPGNGQISVLDVGGTHSFWKNAWDSRFDRLQVTLLNRSTTRCGLTPAIQSIVGDARDLSRFSNRHFDFCFSNSVIEHVGTLADQRQMASEIERVAHGYFVQTPYRYFILEPHFHVPFWGQTPLWARTMLHRRFTLGWMSVQPDYLQARIDVEQIRLISLEEMRLLFPHGPITKETIGGLTKSLIATRACY
jgi:hypothetical protein